MCVSFYDVRADVWSLGVSLVCVCHSRLSTRPACFLIAYIRLIHEFSITGSIARQPLLMADQAYDCWFIFISNKFNGYKINLEYDI